MRNEILRELQAEYEQQRMRDEQENQRRRDQAVAACPEIGQLMEERQQINFDHPDAIDFELLCEHLRELKEGRPVEQPIYSYITCSRSKNETVRVEPAEVIIVEGILIFCCKALRDQMDIKLFVDADDDDRLMRVMARDIIERGKTVQTVIERYTKTVKPMYLQFIEPGKRYADIIIPQGGPNKVAIDVIAATIEKSLRTQND